MEDAQQNNQGGAAGAQPTIEQLMEEIRLLRAEQEARQGQGGRPIGDYGVLRNFCHNRAAIRPPPIARRDLEINPKMVALVKQHTFHGLPAENPMEHLEDFEEICSIVVYDGVPDDYIRCKLFPFSLVDKAKKWLRSQPPACFTTWDDCKSAFLDHFYTKSKTVSMRNKILNFGQLNGESFHEAWERFKDYKRECPHHGYSEEQLLEIFYDGVGWEHKNALDAASNGDFMTRDVKGALKLIENLAASYRNRWRECNGSKTTSNINPPKKDELNSNVVPLMKEKQENRRGVQSIDGGSDEVKLQQETTPLDELKAIMQQILLQQQKLADDNQVISAHLEVLDTQVAQVAESVRRMQGTFPTQTTHNQEEDVYFVMDNKEEGEEKSRIHGEEQPKEVYFLLQHGSRRPKRLEQVCRLAAKKKEEERLAKELSAREGMSGPMRTEEAATKQQVKVKTASTRTWTEQGTLRDDSRQHAAIPRSGPDKSIFTSSNKLHCFKCDTLHRPKSTVFFSDDATLA